MPDVSSHETVLANINDGRCPVLGLGLGSHRVTPGDTIGKGDTESIPTLSVPSSVSQDNRDGTYTIVSIDIDAPYMSWNLLSPIVHWIQTGFKVQADSSGPEQPEHLKLTSDELAIAPWAPASPPPGAAPHRYLFLLYAQTAGTAVPSSLKEGSMGLWQRVRFNVDSTVRELGLGEIVAANYFLSN